MRKLATIVAFAASLALLGTGAGISQAATVPNDPTTKLIRY